MALMNKIKGPGSDCWDINFDDLEDLHELGSGNFGTVFKGSWFGTEVAVKKLLDVNDEFMHKYIEREMAILKSLRHPNIVQFMGLSKNQTGLYIVTEFISGGDLRHMLKDTGKDLPWKYRVKMAMDICTAMTYLHSKEAIHRDLKSHNLLIEPNGKLKVCDFGFSRNVANDEVMTMCGTDEWMAPEVSLGEKYDAKADVFSYGMVLYEIITRQKPLKRMPGNKYLVDTAAMKKNVPKDCPPDLFRIVADCTVWDPQKRPDMRDVHDRLKDLYSALPEEGAQAKKSKNMGNELFSMSTVIEEEDDDDVPPKKDDKHAHPPAKQVQVKALREYHAADSGEISFRKGDIIVINDQKINFSEGSAHGHLLNDKHSGWFPLDHVDTSGLVHNDDAGSIIPQKTKEPTKTDKDKAKNDAKEQREKEQREKEQREREQQRDREQREREQREKDQHQKAIARTDSKRDAKPDQLQRNSPEAESGDRKRDDKKKTLDVLTSFFKSKKDKEKTNDNDKNKKKEKATK